MSAVTALAVDVGTSAACQALGMPRASDTTLELLGPLGDLT